VTATVFYPSYPWEDLPGWSRTKQRIWGFLQGWSKFESCASLAPPVVVLVYCCCFVRIENGRLRLANWLGLETTAAPNPCQSKIGVKATPLTVFVRNYSIGFSLVVLIIAPSEIRLQLSGS